MKSAIVRLPYQMVTPRNGFHNLHGIWELPNYVLSFWANGAMIEYLNEADYKRKETEIVESYIAAAKRNNLLSGESGKNIEL